MSGSTALGFPYPTDGDLVAQTDEAIQALADAIEGPAWTNLALINGWANLGAGFVGMRYRKVAGIVYVQGEISGGTAVACAVLPAGYRPSSIVRFVGIANNVVKSIDVVTNGEIRIGSSGLADMSIALAFPAEA